LWDNILHPAGSTETRSSGGENVSDDGGEMWGHAPEPSLSQTPTAFSGHSSPNLDPESEGRGDSLVLEAVEKSLDLWKDQSMLLRAWVALVDKSCNLQLDVTLWAHLTGMVGVLNLYLDKGLQYTW
jgi:hypothetical protein